MPSRNPRALPPDLDPKAMPDHVAIVMDGNGRWAGAKGLPRNKGHEAGEAALFDTVEGGLDAGLSWLTVYAFSTENWLRPPPEVDSLMEIFHETIERELPDLAAQGVRTRFIGRRDRAPEDLQERMETLELETADRERLQLWIAFDYGGRAELADAARRMIEAGVRADEVSEDVFAVYLYAPEMPDPDLVIRTSGELRMSNFLLWQLAYAEFFFSDTLWPDFGEDDLREAVAAYAGRQRRFGRR
jgi:undecaprenyl diphosphate synthase